MKPVIAASLTFVLLFALPQHSPAASMTYGAVDILPGSDVDIRRQVAEQDCALEATVPPRGTPRMGSFYQGAAYRACIYRKGFFGQGQRAYPVPLFGSHSLGG